MKTGRVFLYLIDVYSIGFCIGKMQNAKKCSVTVGCKISGS